MAMQPLGLEAIGAQHGAQSGLARWLRRLGATVTVLLLAVVLAGDRTRAGVVPATVYGQDPLEVLELKVRPNVILVLDTSGSMQWWTPDNNVDLASGDHPRSRMGQAKPVLRQMIQNNQDKVSFQMGTYTMYGNGFDYQAAGDHRFQYVASGAAAPFMDTAADELRVEGAQGDSLGRGLQSWQIVHPQWNRLYFEEDNGANCTATIPGTPKFYGQGSALATDLSSAMNAATCTGGSRGNTYSVSYDTSNGQFTFAATGPNQFRLDDNNTPDNIQRALGGLDTSWATAGVGATTITINPPVTSLERRATHTRVLTSGAHGVQTGDSCTISGAAPAFFDGTRTVSSVPNVNAQFRFLTPTGAGVTPGTGTVVCTRNVPAVAGTTVDSGAGLMLLYRETGTGSSGTGLNTPWMFTETISGTATNLYQLRAGRLWNGEVIRVTSSGEVCGMDFATAATKTVPASITLVAADSSCVPTGNRARFDWGGGSFTGNDNDCNGFRNKSDLIPCDLQSPPAPTQFALVGPYLDDELPLDANGDPADWNGDSTPDYVESQDGAWEVTSINVAPSAKSSGSTPIGNSLIDIKGTANAADTSCITNPAPAAGSFDLATGAATTGACVERNFTNLWNTGLSTGPWAGIPAAQRAIKNHRNPKEKTIVVFVTDGDDTCGTRTGTLSSGTFTGGPVAAERRARRTAYYAEDLYRRIDATEPASSVQTYVVGYGGSFPPSDAYYLNLIAWGGSGLGQGLAGQPNVDWQTDTEANLRLARTRCVTCTDAFVAPDAATLASQLQSIIDQGASSGEFNAQQSITETVFEYVDLASTGATTFDAAIPSNRYRAIVPTRFVSSFTLPGFNGQVKAYQNDGAGGSVLQWSAGDTLWNQVSTAMATCDTSAVGGAIAECLFDDLHGGANANWPNPTIRASGAKIKRRIYTTNRNGVYAHTPDTLINGTSTNRVQLWPPEANFVSTSYSAAKPYDFAMGLPLDSPSGFPPNPVDAKCDPLDLRPVANPKKALNECWFGWMRKRFGACDGSTLPAECTDPDFAVAMKAARREAREITLAFMAGAATIPVTPGIKRSTDGNFSILYKTRPWILADSELATAAVVTPPLPAEPSATPYLAEYTLFRDGLRGGSTNLDTAGAQLRMGFGLRNPDNDNTAAAGTADTRDGLKPVMTVIYAPHNDMLHAFRAGPCNTPGRPGSCLNGLEAGGEELWGFVPFDQLATLTLRAAHEPQGKDNHVYMLARGVRFADVFVPGSYSKPIGSMTAASSNGVWRRILYVGRGIGGKHMTAIDVTSPGPYTEAALETTPPIPLWNRGNPDTENGLTGGTANGVDAGDLTAYETMGETWSIPSVAYIDKTNLIYQTTRTPAGLDYVLFMGSGYGKVGEGTTLFTLDALSGDVVATADVGSRGGVPYRNALVANAVGFNPKAFSLLTTVHPAASQVTRVYIGDLHGRLFKILTARPDVAIKAADLAAAAPFQPVATAVSLLGLPPQPGTPVPHVFVTSGNEGREAGPFRMFAFKDTGSDTNIVPGVGVVSGTVEAFAPVENLHARTFDEGAAGGCAALPAGDPFRGTVQPATAFECSAISVGTCTSPIGRVFYAGTRLSLPNTKFAPETPLACGSGEYPCRSQFDTIIYALGATTGLAAYDLNAGAADDAYRIFRDSRVAAITVQADPDPGRGGSSFQPDEGLMKGTPKPPPPPGIPPTSTSATANVVMTREPGQPAPAIRYGSTVCQ